MGGYGDHFHTSTGSTKPGFYLGVARRYQWGPQAPSSTRQIPLAFASCTHQRGVPSGCCPVRGDGEQAALSYFYKQQSAGAWAFSARSPMFRHQMCNPLCRGRSQGAVHGWVMWSINLTCRGQASAELGVPRVPCVNHRRIICHWHFFVHGIKPDRNPDRHSLLAALITSPESQWFFCRLDLSRVGRNPPLCCPAMPRRCRSPSLQVSVSQTGPSAGAKGKSVF